MSDSENTSETDSPERPTGGKGLALLQLVRIPTVFTAMADIFLGFLLTRPSLAPVDTFAFLLAASVCIYWTGMILNDYFDRDVDSQERPGRPIPSGRIPAGSALKLGVMLNVAGLGLAACAGQLSLQIALLLTLCVWLYDGVLKKTPVAPLLMGSCRLFNVLLGASASPTGAMWWCPQMHVAIGLGIYVCGLTWFARQEAKTSARPQLISASFVINAGLATLFGFVHTAPDNSQRETAMFVLAVISVTMRTAASARDLAAGTCTSSDGDQDDVAFVDHARRNADPLCDGNACTGNCSRAADGPSISARSLDPDDLAIRRSRRRLWKIGGTFRMRATSNPPDSILEVFQAVSNVAGRMKENWDLSRPKS